MAINPLTEKHLEILRELDASCCQTREYLDKCTSCQLNVDKEIQDNEEQARIARSIREQFFPDKV